MAGEYRLQIIIDVINRATPEIKRTVEEAKKSIKELQEVARQQESVFSFKSKETPSASTLRRRGLMPLEEVEKELKAGELGREYVGYIKKLREIRIAETSKLAQQLNELYKSITGSETSGLIGEDLAHLVSEYGSIRYLREQAKENLQKSVQELVQFAQQYKGQLSNLTPELSQTFKGLKETVKQRALIFKFYREADKLAQSAVEKFGGLTASLESLHTESPEYQQFVKEITPFVKERIDALKQYREALLNKTIPQYIQDIQNTIQNVNVTYQKALEEFSSLLEKPIAEGGLAGTPQTEEEVRQVFNIYDKFISQIEQLRLNISKYLGATFRGLIPEDLLTQLQNLYQYISSQKERFLPQYRAISEAYLGALPQRRALVPVEPVPRHIVPIQPTLQQIVPIQQSVELVPEISKESYAEFVEQLVAAREQAEGVASSMLGASKSAQDTAQATSSIKDNLSEIERLAQIQNEYYRALKVGYRGEKIFQEISQRLGLPQEAVLENFKKLENMGALFRPLTGNLKQQIMELYQNIDTTLSQLSSRENIELALNNLRELGERVEAVGEQMARSPEFTKKAVHAIRTYGTELYSAGNFLKDYSLTHEELQQEIENTKNKLLGLKEALESEAIPKTIPNPVKDFISQTRDLNYIFRNLTWTGLSLMFAFRPISEGIERAFSNVAEYALQTQWFSERLGMSTQNIQALRIALDYSNESIDHFATSLAVLSRKIYDAAHGSGVGVRALQELGIQILDSSGMMLPFENILGQLIARIHALREAGVSSAQISAYLTKIFGRENTRLALFMAEDIEKITERLNKAKMFGLVFSDEDQANALKLMEALKDMRNAWQGFVNQIIIGAAGALIPFFNWLRDLATSYRVFGMIFKNVSGDIISYLFIIAKVAVIAGSALFLVASVLRAFVILKGIFTSLQAAATGAAAGITIFGVTLGPVALAVVAFITALALILPEIMGINKAFQNASKGSSEFLKDMQDTFKQFSELAKNAGEDFMDSYAEGMKIGATRARKIAMDIAEELFKYFGGGHSPAEKGPLSNLEYWGSEFINAYREGLSAGAKKLYDDINKIGEGIVNLLNSFAYSLGGDIARLLTGKGGLDLSKYYKQFLLYLSQTFKGIVSDFQSALTNAFTSAIDRLNSAIQESLGIDKPQSLIQRFGKGFFDTLGDIAKSEVRNFFQVAFAPIYGFIDTFFGKAMSGQLTEWLKQQIDLISAQRDLIYILASAFSGGHATGTITSKPHLALVGEEGPEAIIPLSSHRRKRALQLWIETGKKLGVVGYAEGGIVGGNVENLEDWARALGTILINAGNAFRTGILAAIERWENTIRDLPKKIDIERKIEIPEIKRQTNLLDSIRISLIQEIGVMNIIEKHLSNIKSSAQNQITILNKPSKVQKILEIVETDDKNLRQARQDFLKLLQEEIKKPALDINWSLLRSSQYVSFSNLGSLLKEGEEGQEALKKFLIEFENIIKSWRGGKLTAQELPGFELIMKQKGLTELKDFLMNYGAKQQLYDKLMSAFENYHKGVMTANQLWNTIKSYFSGKTDNKNKISGEHALGEAVMALAGQDALSKINRTMEIANKYLPQIQNTLEQRVKEEQKKESSPKLGSGKISSKTELKLLPEFVDSFLRVMFSPLAEIKSAKGFIANLTKYFQIGSTETLNYNNLNKQIDDLINDIEKAEKDFQEGSISTKEYIEKMQKYSASISKLLAKNSDISKAIDEYIKQYQKAKDLSIQIQQALEMIKSGTVPENLKNILGAPEISEETRTQIMNLLSKWQESGGSAEVLQELENVLSNLINGLDATAEIYYQGIEKLNNKLDNLIETQNKINQVANKWLVDAKNTLIQAMSDWAQGDFKGAAIGIADYFRKAFQEGLVDTFMANFKNNIENMAKSFSNIALWLLGGRKEKTPWEDINNIWNNIKPMIDKGLLQPISNFALKMLNFWIKGTQENEAFQALLDPKNWEATANTMGNEITKALAGEKIANIAFPEEGYIGKVVGGLVSMAKGISDIMGQIVGPEKIQGIINGFKLLFKVLGSGTDNIINSVRLLLDPTKKLDDVANGLSKTLGINAKEIKDFFSQKIITLFPGTSLKKEISIESIREGLASMFDKVKGVWDKFFKETPIGKAAAQVGGFIKAGTIDLIGGLMGGPIGSFIGGLISQGLVAVLGEFAGMFQDVYEGFLKDFIQIGKSILKPIIIPILQFLANILKIFMDVLKPFVPLFKVLAEIIGMVITLIGKVFLAYWNTVLKPVIFAFTKALAFVIKMIGYLLKPLDWLLGGIGQKLIDAADAMSQAADEMYQSTGEAKPVEEEKKKDQPISITNLTGNALEGFKQLLAPLNSLNLLPSYFEQMTSYLKEIRDAVVGINPTPTTVSGVATNEVSKEITINNLNIYVDQVADIDINKIVDQVIYQVGVKVKNVSYAKGG
jgi:DNA-binding Lrp family transcriptional regulator